MSKAKMFRRAHDAAMKEAMKEAMTKVAEIRADLDAKLEALAVNTFGPVGSFPADQFGPPATPVKLKCLHCDGRYLSSKMRREYRPRMQAAVVEGIGQGLAALEPLWWCKNADCDGAGFGHDLYEVMQKATRS